jgi:hypothetical protein
LARHKLLRGNHETDVANTASAGGGRSMTYGRVWCPIDQLWRVFPERLAWMAEPCRALAQQWGLRVHTVYAMACFNAKYGPAAIPEAETLYDEHCEAIHDAYRLRSFTLSIDQLLDIARRSRIALERILRVDPNPVRRAKLEAKLAKIDEVRAANAALAAAILEKQQKVN